ncbi:MAG: hypothetical protein MJZ30_09305 [Paludibacteraceae bacterium]|nr:hypothetical protein [Paludibacteraceae bacterium]
MKTITHFLRKKHGYASILCDNVTLIEIVDGVAVVYLRVKTEAFLKRWTEVFGQPCPTWKLNIEIN